MGLRQTLLRGGHDASAAGSHQSRAVAVVTMLGAVPLAVYALLRCRAVAASVSRLHYVRFLSERAAAMRRAVAYGLPAAVVGQVAAAYDSAWILERCTTAMEEEDSRALPEAFRLSCFRFSLWSPSLCS